MGLAKAESQSEEMIPYPTLKEMGPDKFIPKQKACLSRTRYIFIPYWTYTMVLSEGRGRLDRNTALLVLGKEISNGWALKWNVLTGWNYFHVISSCSRAYTLLPILKILQVVLLHHLILRWTFFHKLKTQYSSFSHRIFIKGIMGSIHEISTVPSTLLTHLMLPILC